MVLLSRMHLLSYLLSDLDVDDVNSWIRVIEKEDPEVNIVDSSIRAIEKEDPEVCIDIAEKHFKQEIIDKAVYSIGVGICQNRNHPKVASRTSNNLYAILRVIDYSIDIHEIKKAYMFKALLFHPDKCSSIAAEGATKLINTVWQVLLDPKGRIWQEAPNLRKRQISVRFSISN
ncbi:hypothetical protein LWI28_010443 [Acer negundo]|uniref:J domain-containing protein n=1 Tax=Acer negundo TaxID=4023 RepID=A0AAD5NX17_ACENE|nr:hypothetical protein LWI28_010443 [Acer negundo]